MKAPLPKALLLLMILASIAMAQTYWPVDTAKNPIQRGTHVGFGYVSGTNDAAVVGSIAIGANSITNKAIVLDATFAAQIGKGTNTTDNSIQYGSNHIPLIFTDDTTDTPYTNYVAPMAGCILIGQTNSVDKVWISVGAGTNSWKYVN